MTLIVAEFHNGPEHKYSDHNVIIIRMSIGENIQLNSIGQCKEYPIMNTINKDSLKRHRVSTEDMDICSLVLSLDIVQYGH